MGNNNCMNQKRHDSLVSICSFCEFYYNLTFRQRLELDLGIVCISRNSYPEDLMILSNEELEKRIHSLEKPWWNDMYDNIKDDHKILVILWERSCNLRDLENLYQLWKKGDMEKIDSIYTTTIRRSKFLGNFNIRWIHLFLDYISV